MHRGEGVRLQGGLTRDAAPHEAMPVTCVRVRAPAKVNLYLGIHEIGGPAPFLCESASTGGSSETPTPQSAAPSKHRVDTIMHTLALADTLTLSVLPADGVASASSDLLSLSCDAPLGIPLVDNLAYRAVVSLADGIGRPYLGHEPGQRVRIAIEKHIPVAAGLAGGSSDAAAALLACAHLWGVDPLADVCLSTARSLGADVSFFLYGGAACFDGYGDRLAALLRPVDCPVVIVKPVQGVPTQAAYRAFDEAPVALPPQEPLLSALVAPSILDDERRRCARVALTLANNLAPASERVLPELRDIRTWLSGQPGAMGALLAGSGSSTFALMGTMDAAVRVVQSARERGLLGIATSLAPLGAHII